MKKIFVFILSVAVCSISKAQPSIVSKGHIALSQAPGAPYHLGGNYSLSIHNLIYNNDLSFIGRQTSDNKYLHINVNEQTVKSIELKDAFFIFRNGSNPVQFLYSKNYGKRSNKSNYDSVFYYNFQTQRLAGAVAYQNKVEGPRTLLGDHNSVIDLDGNNNTILLHWLDLKVADHYVALPLMKPSNDLRDETSFTEYPPTSWQTVDYNTTNATLRFTRMCKDNYTNNASIAMDKNREMMRIHSTTTIFRDLKDKIEYSFSADERTKGKLLPGGKLALAVNESMTVKGSVQYYTVIKIFDIRTGKEEKKIPLPNNRTYEVFFSQGKYAVYYDKYPDAQKLTPYLFDMETGVSTEIPFINPLESLFQGKKRFKGDLKELCVAAHIIYDIKDVLFSEDLKRVVITSYMDLGSAEKYVAYTVGDKRVYLENFIDVFEIK